MTRGHLDPCMQNMALSNETVSEGNPLIIQSLIYKGSPNIFEI